VFAGRHVFDYYLKTNFFLTNNHWHIALPCLIGDIRVNCVASGPVSTPLQASRGQPDKIPTFGTETPMKRPGQPVEMAPLYVLLSSQESSYVTGEVYGPPGGFEVS
jgi:NAD(P)-dependent dehydrogenase (short-subunit alcohol dehydrogenase family)